MKRLCLLVPFVVIIAAAPLAAQSKSSPRPTPTPKEKLKEEAPPLPQGAISRLRIIATTGGDDLRENSKLFAFLIARDGRRLTSHALNCGRVWRSRGRDVPRCAGIPNNTRRTFEWDLEPGQVILPADVHRFGLMFQSGSRGPFDTGDNWDLQRLEVEYVTVPGSGPITKGGKTTSAGIRPLLLVPSKVYRFKSNEEWESEPLRLDP